MLNQSPYALDASPSNFSWKEFAGLSIFFDGVLKGDYSLAIVNRQLLRALSKAGVPIAAYTSEPDWQSDGMLNEMPDVAALCVDRYPAQQSYDIHLRNTWPPRCDDMIGRFNAYVCFAWEEFEAPREMIEHFNTHLDLMMVTANFVEQSFRHSGLRIPISVVGNGTDHILNFSTGSTSQPPDKHKILHVSSCFPRKGADALVKAYVQEFNDREPVELCIKTFDNPHNNIESIVAEEKAIHPNSADIAIIKASMPSRALVDLVRTASVLAAPSRGEGFGLPFAEAILLGVPVVTTAYSGQADFCTSETAWLVDYEMKPSSAHVSARQALWADPDIGSLRRSLRMALEDKSASASKVRAGRKLLTDWFKWSDVARRIGQSLAKTMSASKASSSREASFQIDLISTWNQVCGIATYSDHLLHTPAFEGALQRVYARELRSDIVDAEPDTSVAVSRPWGYDFAGVRRLAKQAAHGNSQILWFQHHPGFFSDEDMDFLIEALSRSGHEARVITLHNVRETLLKPAKWLRSFEGIIVHTQEDALMLSSRGLGAVSVIPHGILPPPRGHRANSGETFVVGTFGFLYPHKNVPLLVDAFARAHALEPKVRLKLFNCVRPDSVSYREQALVEAMIEYHGIEDVVEADFRFLDDEDILQRLAGCDVICFPYGDSNESATGAARIALAADRPLLCSTSGVLRDIAGQALIAPQLDPASLAEAMLVLAASPDILALRDAERRAVVERTQYDVIAERHRSLFERLLRSKASS